MNLNRRSLLFSLGAGAAGIVLSAGAVARARSLVANLPTDSTPQELAEDEDFWFQVRQAFATDRALINLNSGGCCQPPRMAMEALQSRQSFAALAPYHNTWHVLNESREGVRQRLARICGSSPGQVAIMRNTTEAMCLVIYGCDLKEGDEVIASNMEFPAMVGALKQLCARRGTRLKIFNVPLAPEDPQVLADAYINAIGPKTRMLLVSHMVFTNGQIFPAKEICRRAREKGVLTVIDGAHSFAQIAPRVAEIGCDYFGASLHKWLCAPMGSGLLWMRKELIPSTWPLFTAPDPLSDDITKFEHYGTHPVPILLSIGEAASFHETLGTERKRARLHYLKKWWTDRVSELPGFSLVTNPAPEHSCALAAFTVEGYKGREIYDYLWNNYNIITTAMDLPDHGFMGVRISPNIYNTLDELKTLIEALRKLPAK